MKHYHKNPRQITKKQFADLQDSLRRLGDLSGIVHDLNSDEIIGGNQRMDVFDIKSAQIELTEKFDQPDEQGTVARGYVIWQDKKYTYRAVMWDDKTREEANIRANKAGGSWDFDMLANEFELDELVEWGFSPEELGIEVEKETKDAEPQIDRAAELNEKWNVKAGDLWQIGEHRLLCGDSTISTDVEKSIGEIKSDMCFTSPPYNAGVSAQLSGNTSIDDNLYGEEYNDNQTEFDYLDLLNKFTDNAIENCKYVFVNIQVLSGNKHAFIEYLFTHSDKFCDVAIWDKQHAAPAAAQRVMDSRFEFILVFGGNGSRAIGTRDFRGMVHNVYSGNPQRHNENADVHAATFPIDFPEYFIKTFTNENESIYEPFAGTGTTMVACQNLSRKCRAIEISPNYCAVILERMATAFPELDIHRVQ